MTEPHFFIVEGKPVTQKNNKQLVKIGGRLVPISNKQVRAWRKSAAEQLAVQWRKGPIEGDLVVALSCYLSNRQRPDVDNLAAAPLDALQEVGVIVNDSQVVDLRVTKSRDNENPRVEIFIWNCEK